MDVFKNLEGKWEFKNLPKDFNPIYRDSIISYLNAFDPLFERAKKTCEFEFILTLLRVKGEEDAGWDPFKNTQEVFTCISNLQKKISDFNTSLHLFLWLYGHAIEASEPYEILANLINICSGNRFLINNFPDKDKGKYQIPQSPYEKIEELERKALKINMHSCVSPLNDVLDRNLRNAIFHADYSLYRGEVRIRKPTKSYSYNEIMKIVNKGIAYYEAFVSIFNIYIRSYDKPKIVTVYKDFGDHPNEKAITIIRKGYGLIGIKDNWTEEELKRGYIPYRLGRFHRYELKLLEKDPFLAILPRDRIKKINNILKVFPRFLREYIVKRLHDKY